MVWIFSMAFLVSLSAQQLPFVEGFDIADGITNGTIHGQHGWVLESGTAEVQTAVSQGGTQALEIQNGQVSHDLSSDGSAVWIHFQARCTAAPATVPTVSSENTSLAFFVNPDLNLVVYSNSIPVVLNTQMPLNQWTRFDVYCDYDGQHWDLAMNGTNVAAGLPLYSTNSSVGMLVIGNDSSSSAYVDEITVVDTEPTAEVPDSDSDGIPDWWEQKNFGGVTSVSAGAVSGNAGLTYLQTYIAALSPTTFDPFVVSPVATGKGLAWSPAPSRLYSVYWTPSLTNAFTWLQDLPYPESEFIDLIHGEQAAGFYQLNVQVAQ